MARGRKKKQLADEAPASAEHQPAPLREFVKHRKLGEIWAVQWVDDRRLAFASGHRCSKPHEQTRGALLAPPLDDEDATIGWLEENQNELEPWEPPMERAELFEAILAQGLQCDESHAAYKASAKETKELKAEWEEDVERLQALIREAREGHERPTLPFDQAEDVGHHPV